MKVILLQQVKGVGKAGDVAEVSDGYAQNYLIPRGLARLATAGALKDLSHKKAAMTRREARDHAEAQELADVLTSKSIQIEAKAGENGHLYGSITAKDIAEAVDRQLKIKVDRKKIEIHQPIKEIGEHPVKARLFPGVEAVITISVKEA